MVAAGSQERRMAERQANGRPGTDKGRGAGTLEAWVRGPGRGQWWYLIPWAVLQESPPPRRVLCSLPSHLCHSWLLPATTNFRSS